MPGNFEKNSRELLIVGIDPGITTGYAALGISGRLIRADSSKHFDLNILVSEIVKLGRVILVGTDKSKVPRLVYEFATKVGARVASPEEDIKVDDKRRMTRGFAYGDEHQSDALASALFAYKRSKPLLDKIGFFAEKNKKHEIRDRIIETVVTRNVSIKSAVSIIEKKEGDNKIMEKTAAGKRLDEKELIKLYNKLRGYENQVRYLRNHSNNLRNRIMHLEKNESKNKGAKPGNEIIDFREKRIISLESRLNAKESDLERLRSLVKRFNNILSNINDYCILKKLDNFGIKEFNFKNKIINIRKYDMILVDEPNIFSEEVIEALKSKVFAVVNKKPIAKKIEEELPFIFINSKNLSIDEDKYFGFVDKKQFEIEKSKIDWVKKIVEDYRNEKLAMR